MYELHIACDYLDVSEIETLIAKGHNVNEVIAGEDDDGEDHEKEGHEYNSDLGRCSCWYNNKTPLLTLFHSLSEFGPEVEDEEHFSTFTRLWHHGARPAAGEAEKILEAIISIQNKPLREKLLNFAINHYDEFLFSGFISKDDLIYLYQVMKDPAQVDSLPLPVNDNTKRLLIRLVDRPEKALGIIEQITVKTAGDYETVRWRLSELSNKKITTDKEAETLAHFADLFAKHLSSWDIHRAKINVCCWYKQYQKVKTHLAQQFSWLALEDMRVARERPSARGIFSVDLKLWKGLCHPTSIEHQLISLAELSFDGDFFHSVDVEQFFVIYSHILELPLQSNTRQLTRVLYDFMEILWARYSYNEFFNFNRAWRDYFKNDTNRDHFLKLRDELKTHLEQFNKLSVTIAGGGPAASLAIVGQFGKVQRSLKSQADQIAALQAQLASMAGKKRPRDEDGSLPSDRPEQKQRTTLDSWVIKKR